MILKFMKRQQKNKNVARKYRLNLWKRQFTPMTKLQRINWSRHSIKTDYMVIERWMRYVRCQGITQNKIDEVSYKNTHRKETSLAHVINVSLPVTVITTERILIFFQAVMFLRERFSCRCKVNREIGVAFTTNWMQ